MAKAKTFADLGLPEQETNRGVLSGASETEPRNDERTYRSETYDEGSGDPNVYHPEPNVSGPTGGYTGGGFRGDEVVVPPRFPTEPSNGLLAAQIAALEAEIAFLRKTFGWPEMPGNPKPLSTATPPIEAPPAAERA